MPADVSVFDKIRTKDDYDRAEAEFYLKKQLLDVRAQGAGGATIQAAKQLMLADPTLDFPTAFSIAKSGIGQGNTYNNGQVENITGAPQAFGNIEAAKGGAKEQAVKDVDLRMDPAIEAAKDTAKTNAATATSDSKALPIIDQLSKLNKDTFDIPYVGAVQGAAKVIPAFNKQTTSLDLMRQARLEVAAPLAKQLGVNPTDKDFQASLDRIFDENSTRESRQAQIDALGQRIRDRQSGLIQPVTMQDLNAPTAPMPGAMPPPANLSALPPTAAPAFDPRNIPMAHVQALRANPDKAGDFDAKYGAGAAQFVLRQGKK